MVQKNIYYLYTALLALLFMVSLPYAWKLFSIIFMSKNCSIMGQLELYKWVGCGIVLFFFIRGFINKNIMWMETFSHELTHIIVALLFFRKIHSFQALEVSGEVRTSGHNNYGMAPLALAPYCLPIFTYMLLFLRCLINDQGVWIYDILIGTTIAFHWSCFSNQTGNHQTDINQYPLLFSYTYIITALLINACIIIVSFFPHYNVYTSVLRYLKAVFEVVVNIFA